VSEADSPKAEESGDLLEMEGWRGWGKGKKLSILQLVSIQLCKTVREAVEDQQGICCFLNALAVIAHNSSGKCYYTCCENHS